MSVNAGSSTLLFWVRIGAMETIYHTTSAEETRSLGKELSQKVAPKTLLCLRGELGSGKTTFTQGLLEGLGAEKPFVSPTFVIMKEYELKIPTKTGIERIYHTDAYRVEEKDFETIGFSEWCADPKGIVILEWPERISGILPKGALNLSFKALSENERRITFSK